MADEEMIEYNYHVDVRLTRIDLHYVGKIGQIDVFHSFKLFPITNTWSTI